MTKMNMHQKQKSKTNKTMRAVPSKNLEFFYQNGLLLSQKGAFEQAIKSWICCLILDPSHSESLAILASSLFRQDFPEVARDLYKRALSVRPDFTEVLINLAPLYLTTEHFSEAEDVCRKAIATRSESPIAFSNLGIALKAQGHTDRALHVWRIALLLEPSYAKPYAHLAHSYQMLDSPEKAVAHFSYAIFLNPLSPEGYGALASFYLQRKDFNRAKETCLTALSIKNDFIFALLIFADCQKQTLFVLEAEKLYQTILSLNPGSEIVYSRLTSLTQDRGDYEEAFKNSQRAVFLVPKHPFSHDNHGTVCHSCQNYEKAYESYKKAFILDPSYCEIYSNLCYFLNSYNKVEKAVVMGKRALFIAPNHKGAHHNLAMALLTYGDLLEGWKEYEWRWQTPQMQTIYRDFHQPQWQGEEGFGRYIFIHAEQGYGDSLQFCRYVPMVASLGWKVILETPTALMRLMKTLQGVSLLIRDGDDIPPFDVHCSLLTLPYIFQTTLETIPSSVPYLRAENKEVIVWNEKLKSQLKSKDNPKIGIVWAGNPRAYDHHLNACDQRRSIFPDRLKPLLSLSHLDFVSLQKGGPRCPEDIKLIDFMDEVEDFADTAALMMCLDLIITVDTSMVHLAGAIGRPVWLFDRFDSCWRWLRDRDTSPWYPQLQIFRQEQPGNWIDVIDRVIKKLRLIFSQGYHQEELAKNSLRAEALSTLYARQDDSCQRLCLKMIILEPEQPQAYEILQKLSGVRQERSAQENYLLRLTLLSPLIALNHCNLGSFYFETQRVENAMISWRKATNLDPLKPEYLYNLGIGYKRLGQIDRAVMAYKGSLCLHPSFAPSMRNLGNIYKQDQQRDETLWAFSRLRLLESSECQSHRYYAVILKQFERYEESIQAYKTALILSPSDDETWFDYAQLSRGPHYDRAQAIKMIERSVQINSLKSKNFQVLATLYYQSHHNILSIVAQRKAIILETLSDTSKESGLLVSYTNLGIVYYEENRMDEAISIFRRALSLDQQSGNSHYNLAMALLSSGQFEEGWLEYEWRWFTTHMIDSRLDFDQPRWQGDEGKGRTILIYPEQGYGDVLQFCRYIPLLAERGWTVIVDCWPSLYPLFKQWPSSIRLRQSSDPVPQFDVQCPIASLPGLFKTTPTTIPHSSGYLNADPDRVESWKKRLKDLSETTLKVGLVWSGNPRIGMPKMTEVDKKRSIPLSYLKPLLSCPDVTFLSLQKEGPKIPDDYPIIDFINEMTDFADTAALIDALDIVISVDTSVVHLAGALGKPVWLLDRKDSCWRWLRGQMTSPWYDHLKIYRQSLSEDWADVIDTVKNDLLLRGLQSPQQKKRESRDGFLEDESESFNLKAIDFLSNKHYSEAVQQCLIALILRPNEGSYYNNLKVSKRRMGQAKDILPLIEKIVFLNPHSAQSHCDLGAELMSYHRIEEARQAFLTSVHYDPLFAEAWYNLGLLSRQLNNLIDSSLFYRIALILKCDLSMFWNNYGNLLQEKGVFDEAVRASYYSYVLNPQSIELINNYASALELTKQIPLAENLFREALHKNPNYADAYFNLSLILLKQGDFEEGFKNYEWRWQSASLSAAKRHFDQPYWTGDEGYGRSIYIYGEQGLGDIIQFCRYIPMLAQKGWRVFCEVRQPLMRIMKTLSGVEHWILQGDPLPSFDVHCPIVSLAYHFKTTFETIPQKIPYLKVDKEQSLYWKKRLKDLYGESYRVGLVWAGTPKLKNLDLRRSFLPDRFKPLFDCPDIQFFSLQKTPPFAQASLPLFDHMGEMNDFSDTAAFIDNLDLVISVDTAVAHLAGAIGKKIWLLSRYDGCWRWLLNRSDSPWYPTMRIFNQEKSGDWIKAIEDIRLSLLSLKGKPRSETLFTHPIAILIRNPSLGQVWYRIGMYYYDNKNYESAKQCWYRSALIHSDDSDIFNYLSLVMSFLYHIDNSLSLIMRAIILNPQSYRAYWHFNRLLPQTTDPRSKEGVLRRLVHLNPLSAEPLSNLGAFYLSSNQIERAISCWEIAIKREKTYAEAYFNLGIASKLTEKNFEAIRLWALAIILKCDFELSYNSLGNLYFEQEEYDKAEEFYKKYLILCRNKEIVYNKLAKLYEKKNDYLKSYKQSIYSIITSPSTEDSYYICLFNCHKLDYYQKSIYFAKILLKFNPFNAAYYKNIGVIYHDKELLEKTWLSYKIAILLEPSSEKYYSNAAYLMMSFNKVRESIELSERSIFISQSYVLAHYNLFAALLSQGRYQEGGREFAWRWHHPEMISRQRHYDKPLWKGEKGEGKFLFIYVEGGYGDYIQNCRFIKLIAQRGWKVILEVRPPLIKLLEKVEGIYKICPYGEEPPYFDSYCPMGDLIFTLGLEPHQIPTENYIKPEANRVAFWKRKLIDYKDKPKIGVVWYGSVTAGHRTMPTEAMRPLFKLKKFHYFNLQKDKIDYPDDYKLIDYMDDIDDFMETAALVKNLDLVLAVDTAIVHLAAAMGKPVWLLARFDTDWRWMRDREDSPWYPSAKIFRQKTAGDWPSVIEQVVKALKKF